MEVGHFGPLWSQFGNLAISKKFTGFRWKHQQIFPVFLVNSRNLSSFHRDKKTRLPDSLNALLKRTTKTILRKKAIIHCWLLNGTWDALCNKLLSVRRRFQLSSLSSCSLNYCFKRWELFFHWITSWNILLVEYKWLVNSSFGVQCEEIFKMPPEASNKCKLQASSHYRTRSGRYWNMKLVHFSINQWA